MRAERPSWVRVDAGDDAAIVDDGVAVTVDTLVEGVHWDDRSSAADVGYKLIAVSVSDLMAMGAAPRWAVLSVSLRAAESDRRAWVAELARGIAEACSQFGVHVVGGDTTRVPGNAPRVVGATLTGRCVSQPMTRSGGEVGDTVWVSGTLGLAGAGWRLDAPPGEALLALRRPCPPLTLGLALARSGLVTSAMDLSDGLASDLPKLCLASGTGARIDPDRLPAHPVLRSRIDRIDLQMGSGDDYELLWTTAPSAVAEVHAIATQQGVAATAIGELVAGSRCELMTGTWPTPAFSHFGATS